MGNLFISYARKDVVFAQKLNTDLLSSDVRTWIDELGIRGGDDWPERVAKAIEESQAMLVILSPDSVCSRWVIRELSYADQLRKPILPIIYRPCQFPRSFNLRFGNIQRIDFSHGAYSRNLSELLVSLRELLEVTKNHYITNTHNKNEAEIWNKKVSHLREGQLIEGTITHIFNYGTFAKLGEDNLEGFIHVSELSSSRVEHPVEIVEVGETLTLRVIKIDKDRQQIDLSLTKVDSAAYADIDWKKLREEIDAAIEGEDEPEVVLEEVVFEEEVIAGEEEPEEEPEAVPEEEVDDEFPF